MHSDRLSHLEAFIAQFAGYGNPKAPLWFVGMEEGSGRSLEELRRRVHAWHERGRKTLEDLPSYHHAIGLPRHFEEPYPLQRTWAPLLRFLLAFRGVAATPENIRVTQANGFGTLEGTSALVELLPLPAPGTDRWPYSALARSIPELETRASYREAVSRPRTLLLKALIETARPEVVIFYGLGYRREWEAIAGCHLSESLLEGRRFLYGERQATRIVAVPHPVARGSTRTFWEQLGSSMRRRDAHG